MLHGRGISKLKLNYLSAEIELFSNIFRRDEGIGRAILHASVGAENGRFPATRRRLSSGVAHSQSRFNTEEKMLTSYTNDNHAPADEIELQVEIITTKHW